MKIVTDLETQRSAGRGIEEIATRVPVIREWGSEDVPQSDVGKADARADVEFGLAGVLVQLIDRTAGVAQRRRQGPQFAPADSVQGERPSEPAGVQPARAVGPGRRAVARSGR